MGNPVAAVLVGIQIHEALEQRDRDTRAKERERIVKMLEKAGHYESARLVREGK